MSRITVSRWYVVLSLFGLSGCGSMHLGARYGERYHHIFKAQAALDGEPGAIDATDAKRTMSKRHAGASSTTTSTTLPGIDLAPSSSSMSSASGSGIGADANPNPIRLDAK